MRQAQELLHGLASRLADLVGHVLAEVLGREVLRPVAFLGAAGDDPAEARLVVQAGALEHLRGGADLERVLLAGAAHPNGVDEGEAGEVFPAAPRSSWCGYLAASGASVTTLSPMRRAGLRLFVTPSLRHSVTSAQHHVLAGVEVHDAHAAGELLPQQHLREHDGGVAVGVGGDGGPAFRRVAPDDCSSGAP